MKILITILVLCISSIGLSQTDENHSEPNSNGLKVNDINVSVTVDSAEEVKSTFKIEDIKELLKTANDVDHMSFEIICNGDTMSNGEKSTLSYKVKGDSNDINGFLKSIKKMRKAAIKYYNNKL